MRELSDLFRDPWREHFTRRAILFILRGLLLFHREFALRGDVVVSPHHSGNAGLTGAGEGEKLGFHAAKPFVM